MRERWFLVVVLLMRVSMTDTKVQYIVIYGMADSPKSPSAIARFIKCKDPLVHKYEMCNPTHPWFESNNVFKYFKGLETGGYEISEKIANKFLESWEKNWSKKKR
tara:strand:- start:4940 stop:5254 length:315 start_codon:yes stop_codon:yes gene_type:complete